MSQVAVDWKPVLVAESFSGLIAARWAAIDSRVRALVLCASFARNPMGYATGFGAAWPELVKLGPALMRPCGAIFFRSRAPALVRGARAHRGGPPRRRGPPSACA
jgi:pimeloyl-ACP methyl ester carboxylesterase